jgi:hypothetical protein
MPTWPLADVNSPPQCGQAGHVRAKRNNSASANEGVFEGALAKVNPRSTISCLTNVAQLTVN